MKHFFLSILAIFALAAAAGAQAAPRGVVYGAGNMGCDKWVQARSSAAASASVAVYVNWILGFVTGAQTIDETRQYGPVDVAGVQASMDIYCKAHPNDTIMKGARALVVTLRVNP